MTEQDFRRRSGELFRRVPLVPIALELTDGRRIVIDRADQLEFAPIGLRVTVASHRPGFVNYDEIRDLLPVDELPAQPGGLSYSEFYSLIRPRLWAEPFQPFEIEFRNGEKLRVVSAGRLSLSGRIGVYLPQDRGGVVRFTYDQVARISTLDPASVG